MSSNFIAMHHNIDLSYLMGIFILKVLAVMEKVIFKHVLDSAKIFYSSVSSLIRYIGFIFFSSGFLD